MITKVINVNLHQPIYEKITAKQGDIASRYLLFHLLDGDKPFDLSNKTVRVYAIKPDKTEIFNDLIINDETKGYCTLELTSQCLAEVGIVKMELYISQSGKVLTSIPFDLEVIACINTANSVTSTNEFSALEAALSSLQDYNNLKREIIQARKGHATVGGRLDNFDSQLYTTKNDLTKKRDITVKITNEDLDISDDSKKIQLLNLSDEVIGAMSGHTTVRPTLGEKEVTRDKIADFANDRLQVTDEVLSMYPFQKRATLKHKKTNNESIEILKKAIKRIELYNADEKRKYFLNYINRSNDGNNILTIIIKNDLDVIVAKIDKWYYDFQAGVNKVELNEQNNSGVKCYLYIDFSIFTGGNGYYDMGYDETGIAQECLYSFKEPIEKTEWLRISLPSKIYGVVGQELNIYFDNIILCNNINNYQIDVECEKGIQQVERWTYTPTTLESFNITIKVYKDGKTLVASKSTTIDVKSNTGTGTKKALFIGDSLTDYNQYIQEIVNLFIADSCDIKLLGTKGWNEQARHEGRSGWSTVSYAQRASVNGVVNPFWNTATSKFDFSYYLTNNNIETPDIVVIMLGTNDVGGNSANATTIANIKTMITSIKASNSNIKIGVALTPPPASTQDGFGKMNQCWSTRFQAKQGNFDLVEDFITEFDNNKIENVSVIPTNVNLDTVNNFPYEEVKPNSRATVTIKRISDNVHPTESGMYQFADTYYGWLKSYY